MIRKGIEEIGVEEWSCCYDYRSVWFIGFWNWFVGERYKKVSSEDGYRVLEENKGYVRNGMRGYLYILWGREGWWWKFGYFLFAF